MRATRQESPTARDVLDQVERTLDDGKIADVIVIDLTGKTPLADFMVIGSGASSRQLAAVTDYLQVNLKALGAGPLSVEGQGQGDWVLVDAGDVIVHLFRPEVRRFYNLEKMWGLPSPGPENSASIEATST